MSATSLRWVAALAIATSAFGVQASSEFRLSLVRQSLTGTYRHYQQFIDGMPVVGAERVTVERAGGTERITYESAARAPLVAFSAAGAAQGGERVYVNLGGEARPAFRTFVERRPLERFARYIDASTGVVLREDALFYTIRGRVFDVNPVAKLNRPDLRDDNDSAAAVPEAAYDEVDLPGLDPSGPLRSANAQIVDIQAPFTPRADAGQSLDFDRSQDQFEEVNAWFQIDRAQRYLQSLGYTGPRALVAYSIPIDAHAANGTDNSFYVPSDVPGQGTLFFGDGGTDDAEDSDIILHEFAHAIHDWIIPGGLTGAVSAQSRAISEGLGDYWSFSSTYQKTLVSGRDPFCIADWDARCAGDDSSQNCGYPTGADCLRRVDTSKTIADYIFSEDEGTEHLNGEMWSSALREIFLTLTAQLGVDQGKRLSDTIVLESLFGLPPAPQFQTVAERMIDADRILRAGADVSTICSAMTSRGLIAAAACGNVPRGEFTVIQGPDRGVPIPDAGPAVTSSITISDSRSIVSLAVRVDIAHPNRGDLVISLVSPDGTTLRLKASSAVDRTANVHATFGIDAPSIDPLSALAGRSAAGTWKLVVSDVLAGDAGTLESWGLVIQFSGDVPQAARPTGGDRKIIAAAGHLTGAGGADYRSDLYVLNRGPRATTLTIVYTPSGSDGRTGFAALQSVIDAGQTVQFIDVVQQLFAMTGIGTLEIRGDLSSIVVWSSTYRQTSGGTLSQSVEATSPESSAGAGDLPLTIAPIPAADEMRTNVGVVETAGVAGVVRIRVRSQNGETAGTIDLPIAPFSHLQIPLERVTDRKPAGVSSVDVSVVSGSARVIAYGSSIDLDSGDPMYLPSSTLSDAVTHGFIPALISATGAGARPWATELFYADASQTPQASGPVLRYFHAFGPQEPIAKVVAGTGAHFDDAVQTLFGAVADAGQVQVDLEPGQRIMTRTWTIGPAGRVGERIDALPARAAMAPGRPVDAVHAENTPAFRTNLGITNIGNDDAVVRVTLLSAAGRPLGSAGLSVPAHALVFLPLTSLSSAPVEGGRVHFEVVSGAGNVIASISVIDNGTNDPTFVLAE